MTTKIPRGAVPISCLFVTLLALLPACTSRDDEGIVRPAAVKRLLADNAIPVETLEGFTPIPEEELARFQPPETMPYTIGIGDRLRIQALNSGPLAGYENGFEARVKTDGKIRLPKVGKIVANGRTALEVEDELTERFKVAYQLSAIASVEVEQFESRQYYVMGEVSSPGSLPVNGKTTLLQALISAGATDQETADLGEAYVIRNRQPIPFSVRDIVMRGHPIGQWVLQANDIIYVPHVKERTDYVYVLGEVGQPSRIKMDHDRPRGSAGDLTLAGAVAQAGGLAPRASLGDITIYRGGWPCPKRFCIARCDLYRYGDDIHLRAGDRVAVGTSAEARFQDALGPTLGVISATSSSLSLGLSVLSLTK